MPDLGNYAIEVLSAYAVTIGLIVILVVVSLRQSVRMRRALKEVEEARAAQKAASARETATDGQ